MFTSIILPPNDVCPGSVLVAVHCEAIQKTKIIILFLSAYITEFTFTDSTLD